MVIGFNEAMIMGKMMLMSWQLGTDQGIVQVTHIQQRDKIVLVSNTQFNQMNDII